MKTRGARVRGVVETRSGRGVGRDPGCSTVRSLSAMCAGAARSGESMSIT
jgi:hypothetical protein